MISFTVGGSTDTTRKFLERMAKNDLYSGLDSLAQRGVAALQAATPVDTGVTASSWAYEIEVKNGVTKIFWTNTHSVNGVNIAIILQYGHGTGTGGYVQGRDYINPALKPIFDEIAEEVWKRVKTP